MKHDIRPIAASDVEGFRGVLDVVAQEKRFLSFLEAPPLDQMRAFVIKNINEGLPQFVVLIDDQVVGWCDILPNARRTVQTHCGTLGMGLLPQHRGHGIGRNLIRRTIDAALAFGLTRIDLTVRESNDNAIALYKAVGFETEGLHRKAVCIEGRYENVLSMAFVIC
jgi:ribosomal protein S18 acetylase RimI-like enzyme